MMRLDERFQMPLHAAVRRFDILGISGLLSQSPKRANIPDASAAGRAGRGLAVHRVTIGPAALRSLGLQKPLYALVDDPVDLGIVFSRDMPIVEQGPNGHAGGLARQNFRGGLRDAPAIQFDRFRIGKPLAAEKGPRAGPSAIRTPDRHSQCGNAAATFPRKRIAVHHVAGPVGGNRMRHAIEVECIEVTVHFRADIALRPRFHRPQRRFPDVVPQYIPGDAVLHFAHRQGLRRLPETIDFIDGETIGVPPIARQNGEQHGGRLRPQKQIVSHRAAREADCPAIGARQQAQHAILETQGRHSRLHMARSDHRLDRRPAPGIRRHIVKPSVLRLELQRSSPVSHG